MSTGRTNRMSESDELVGVLAIDAGQQTPLAVNPVVQIPLEQSRTPNQSAWYLGRCLNELLHRLQLWFVTMHHLDGVRAQQLWSNLLILVGELIDPDEGGMDVRGHLEESINNLRGWPSNEGRYQEVFDSAEVLGQQDVDTEWQAIMSDARSMDVEFTRQILGPILERLEPGHRAILGLAALVDQGLHPQVLRDRMVIERPHIELHPIPSPSSANIRDQEVFEYRELHSPMQLPEVRQTWPDAGWWQLVRHGLWSLQQQLDGEEALGNLQQSQTAGAGGAWLRGWLPDAERQVLEVLARTAATPEEPRAVQRPPLRNVVTGAAATTAQRLRLTIGTKRPIEVRRDKVAVAAKLEPRHLRILARFLETFPAATPIQWFRDNWRTFGRAAKPEDQTIYDAIHDLASRIDCLGLGLESDADGWRLVDRRAM